MKDFLHSSFGNFLPDIIALQEVWNVPLLDEFSLDGYHPIQFKIRDESRLKSNTGGGIALYIKNSLSFQHIPDISVFEPRVFESQVVKIKTGKNSYTLLINVYRPNSAPFADIKRSNTILKEMLDKLKSHKDLKNSKDIIICGDFNIDLLKSQSHIGSGVYLDTLLEQGILPLITLPTRIFNHSASLIDHISTNISDDSYDTGIIVSDISDHFPVFYIRHFKEKRQKPQPIKVRKINEESKAAFFSLLEGKDWGSILNDSIPETAFDNFFTFINNSYEMSFPEKTVTPSVINKSRSPWMTQGIFNSRMRKMKLYNKKIKKKSPESIRVFKEYNALYTQIVRKAKYEYYNNKFNEYKNNCKKTWQTINEVLGRRKNVSDIPETFISNEKIISGSLEIAEGFNNFFVNIGPKLASEIPKSKKHFSDYLGNPCNENFVFANMNHNIINEALSKLKNKNSCGPDGISTNLLKFIAPSILDPLTHLLNLSFKTGFIPSCLKTAEVKPIFKKGDNDRFTNFRPISLLSSFSKLLEKVAATQIMRYLNKFKLLYEHQYGFRAGHNTEQPVVHLLDKIYNALNSPEGSKYTLAIFIDLTKAFDTCPVDVLLHKLNFYGFRGVANLWFKNYLTSRRQYVAVRGEHSSHKEISMGVPQGSILGPILFILLINDLPNASKRFFTLLYADDTTLQISSSDLLFLFKTANSELEKLADWFRANHLTLNISKTKYILFRDKKMSVDFSDLNLEIDNDNIERIGEDCKEKYFKFVGLHLDEFLTWDHHAKYVRSKAASTVYSLSKLKNLLPKQIKHTVYNSLFRSYIEFGISCWGGTQNSIIGRISILQKRAVRYIDNLKYNSHTGPSFLKLKILRFKDMVQYNQACLMYKYVYDKLPISFNGMFTKLNSFERNLSFQLPIASYSNLRKFPSYSIIRLWNSLPLELKRKKSLNIFKRHLSLSLSESYNSPCTSINCYSCRK